MCFYRLRLVHSAGRPSRSGAAAYGLLGVLSWLLAAVLLAAPVRAQGGSVTVGTSATVSLEQGVVAVSVSPNSMIYGNCHDGSTPTPGLVAHGTCDTSLHPVLVTNQSNVKVHINVKGAPAMTLSGGAGWSLTTGLPGANQFAETVQSASSGVVLQLTEQDQCDQHLESPLCQGLNPVTPGSPQTAVSEYVKIVGPAGPLAQTTFLTTNVIWTAIAM